MPDGIIAIIQGGGGGRTLQKSVLAIGRLRCVRASRRDDMAPQMGRGLLSSLLLVTLCFGLAQSR